MKTLLLFAVAATVAAQTGDGTKQSTPKAVRLPKKPLNNHFAIAYPTAARIWKVGGGNATSAAIYQSIGDTLAQKLVQKQFVRVPTLDEQCCSIQLEVLDFQSALSVRVSVMDIDKQPVYTKPYKVEVDPKQTAISSKIAASSGQLVTTLLADPDFMKALAGT